LYYPTRKILFLDMNHIFRLNITLY
jgi:hypothetical protein